MKQEIFAVGTWNRMPFSLADLKKMEGSFNKLKNVLQVPLKLGHNDEQPVTNGQPALGWVTSIEVVGQKLVAVFDNVPPIVERAFEKKLYRNVSVEMDFDVHHKGAQYDFVITAVALLGADIPAVNVLNDLGALMSRNGNMDRSDFVAGSHANFTTVKGSLKEKSLMTPEEIAAMQLENATLKGEVAAQTANFSALETKAAAEKKDAEARFAAIEADQKKVKVDAKRTEFTGILEEAVKAKSITPVQRETFSKVLKLDDDEHILTLDAADVKGLFAAAGKPADNGTGLADDDDDEAADVSLTQEAHQYMAKSGEQSFARAVDVVMAGNPALARDYINQNGEVSH